MPLWVPALIGGFWMQYNDFLTRITSLYGSLTSPVLLCMQNSVISIRFTSLHWFQPSSVVFAFKKLSFGPGITSLCGSLTSPVDLCMQNGVISTWITSLYGFQPSSVVFACKERLLDKSYKSLLVPDLICRFEPAKHRDLHQNDKSIWVPALICGLCIQKSDFSNRIPCLHGSHPLSVLLCIRKSNIWTRIACLYGSQTSPVVLCIQRTLLAPELLVSMCASPQLWFLHAKQRLLGQNTTRYRYQTSPVVLCLHNSVISTRTTSLYGFQPSSVVLCIQNSAFRT